MMAPAPRKRAGNIAALIYDRLRAEILRGERSPGSALVQEIIAQAHGASRGPVREALRQLQQDQLVVGEANKRFTVAPFDIAELESVLSLHLVNVTLAIEVSAPFLTDMEIETLVIHQSEMDRARSREPGDWEKAYREFILTLVKHAGPRVAPMISELIDNTQRHRHIAPSRLPADIPVQVEYAAVLEAAVARDGKLCAQRYAALMSRASLFILTSAAPIYDPSRLRRYVSALGAA